MEVVWRAGSGRPTWLDPSKGCAGSDWAKRVGMAWKELIGCRKAKRVLAETYITGDNINWEGETCLDHWIWDSV